jgi:hypothetical protein
MRNELLEVGYPCWDVGNSRNEYSQADCRILQYKCNKAQLHYIKSSGPTITAAIVGVAGNHASVQKRKTRITCE